MPFVNKEILLTDFLEGLYERIKSGGNTGALIDFELYLKDGLVEEVKEHSEGWDGRCNAGDFDAIYPMAVGILRGAAGRNFSEAHLDAYQVAHEVSVAFCEEINQVFQCTPPDQFDLIPIQSFTTMAAKGDKGEGGADILNSPDLESQEEKNPPKKHDHSYVIHGRSPQTDKYPDGCLVHPDWTLQ